MASTAQTVSRAASSRKETRVLVTKVASQQTRVYLDEFDLSGDLNSSALDLRNELANVTTFADKGPRRVEGNYDTTHKHTGFFDGAGDGIDDAIFAALGSNSDHYLAQLFAGDDEGAVGYESVVRIERQPRVARVGEAVSLSFDAAGSNSTARTAVLRNGSITGVGSGAGREVGATSAGQVVVVTARVVSGTFTNLALDIQQSSDDGSTDPYTNVNGLSFMFSEPGVSRKTISAATETWKRVRVSAFAGTGAQLLVTIGVLQGA